MQDVKIFVSNLRSFTTKNNTNNLWYVVICFIPSIIETDNLILKVICWITVGLSVDVKHCQYSMENEILWTLKIISAAQQNRETPSKIYWPTESKICSCYNYVQFYSQTCIYLFFTFLRQKRGHVKRRLTRYFLRHHHIR